MSIFDNLKLGSSVVEKVTAVRHPTPPVGTHKLALVAASEFDTKDLGSCAKLQYVVVSSTNPEVKAGQKFEEVYFPEYPILKEQARARARLRQVVRQLIDAEVSDCAAIDAACAGIWGPTQTARGVVVECTGTERISKKTGNKYIAAEYASVKQSDDEIIAMRAAIESNTVGVEATPKAPAVSSILDRLKKAK